MIASALVDAVHRMHARGWAPGTGGNFSVVAGDRVLMTPSGIDKGRVTARDLVELDRDGRQLAGTGKPSAETALHVQLLRSCNAGAVFHVHSVWNTLASLRGELVISGLEMLKGLAGVTTHEHRERVPIVPNSQDMAALAATFDRTIREHPEGHGILVSGHGLYTWGDTLGDAERHVEIFEFLFEVVGRQASP